MDKARHFKFTHRWTIAITSQRKTNGGGQGHVTHFLNFTDVGAEDAGLENDGPNRQ